MNWSKEQLQDALKKNPALRVRKADMDKLQEVKESKYNAQAITIDGHRFPSLAEAERYGELVVLKMAGVIKNFELQPHYDIGAGMRYTPDFKVEYLDGHIEVEEVKGHMQRDSLMRIKLFREKYKDIPLRIIRKGEVEE